MKLTGWTPKSLVALRDYNGKKFAADLAAGVTVGLVALPLSMAFAIASGAPPESGLYTAVVAGFAISALGGSRNQIGGPTGAFVVIISGILARYGFNGLLICTIMAGVLLILLGATGLGAAVKFIPRPVIVGFTNGIAILIAGGFCGAPAGGAGERPYHLADHHAAGQRLAAAHCGDHPLVAAGARLHRGPGRGYRRSLLPAPAGGDSRHALRGYPFRLSSFTYSGLRVQHSQDADLPRHYRCAAGSH
jgi:hypothetical protein